MNFTPGSRPVRVLELPQISDRFTFLYLERCTIGRADNALTATSESGTIHVPSAMLSCVLLGPGTRVTHQSMVLLGESGTTTVWVGEGGVRMYAAGRSLARTALYLQRQVARWSDPMQRISVCRAMYTLRFPDEPAEGSTLAQLRGMEGARVKRIYRREAERVGLPWKGRHYDRENWKSSDPVNQALSAGNAALYGVVHSVIAALGLSPGLGFVHEGHALSFVHDVADLYKAECVIPLAFDIAVQEISDVDAEMRRRIRTWAHQRRLLERIVTDLRRLLAVDLDAPDALDLTTEVLLLWDDQAGSVTGGTNWADPW